MGLEETPGDRKEAEIEEETGVLQGGIASTNGDISPELRPLPDDLVKAELDALTPQPQPPKTSIETRYFIGGVLQIGPTPFEY